MFFLFDQFHQHPHKLELHLAADFGGCRHQYASLEMKKELILSFESSCDDTGVAVIDTEYNVLSNVVSSQFVHQKYGGVVPELASRDHLKNITRVCEQALSQANISAKDVDAIAVSVNPGLIGALLVGVSFAKALAYAENKPLIAVNHLLGHIAAIRLDYPDLAPPYLALIVSGGHTQLAHFTSFGEFEMDDAAGEAFGHSGRRRRRSFRQNRKNPRLGLSRRKNHRRFSQKRRPEICPFHQSVKQKKQLQLQLFWAQNRQMNYVEQAEPAFVEEHKADIAASVQESIVDSLHSKTRRPEKDFCSMQKASSQHLTNAAEQPTHLLSSIFTEC